MHMTFCLAALMYVLTGGSSVGKTTIIKELEQQGEKVIHEAATDWITERIQAGAKEYWKEEDLGYNILKLQMAREEPFLEAEGRVFIDRGIFDNHAYVMHSSLAGTRSLAAINAALEGIDLNQRYAAVFLILPYNERGFSPYMTELRRENLKEVEQLQCAFFAIYSRHRNFIVISGGLNPQDRAALVLSHVERLEDGLKP